jgi:hypothetical protein
LGVEDSLGLVSNEESRLSGDAGLFDSFDSGCNFCVVRDKNFSFS